jgi:benzaldehyde dehydrogenase (NAD)
VAAAYTEALARHGAALRIGNPHGSDAQIGPMIDAQQVRRVADAVNWAVAQGARVVSGGRPDGLYFPPTVLADVSPSQDIFHTEVFGPVATVTAYRDDEEAVALANTGDYGLVAAVYSGDAAHGAAIAARLNCGVVHVGDQTVNHDPALPFGGIGASGNAAGFGGPAGLEAFTRWQTTTVSTPSRGYPF